MDASKVLFLDFDGVLNSQKNLYNEKKAVKRTTESMISLRNLFWVGLFCNIKKYKVVVSSSWRGLWNDNMVPCAEAVKTTKLLKRFGIKLIGKTTRQPAILKNEYELNKLFDVNIKDIQYWRGTQILQYIEEYNLDINKILIFDDDISDIAEYEILRKRVICPSFYKKGFSFKHFLKALKIAKN